MPPHQSQLVGAQRSPLVENRVRNPDLADVVEEEAVFKARVVEQARLDGLGQLERVSMDAERMAAGRLVSCLERVCEGGDCLAVGVLEQPALRTLDLDDTTEIAGIGEQLV